MKLIIETTELEDFATKIQQWYADCLVYVLSKYDGETIRSFRQGDEIKRLKQEYETKHPRPTWKDLL
jgi:hypothetical protein